jgi:hypothetical protein
MFSWSVSSPNVRSQRHLRHNAGLRQRWLRPNVLLGRSLPSMLLPIQKAPKLSPITPGFPRSEYLPECVYLGGRLSLGVQHTRPTCSAPCRRHEVVPEPVSRFRLTALHTSGAFAVEATREMVIGWVLSGRVMELGRKRNVALCAQRKTPQPREHGAEATVLGPSTTTI